MGTDIDNAQQNSANKSEASSVADLKSKKRRRRRSVSSSSSSSSLGRRRTTPTETEKGKEGQERKEEERQGEKEEGQEGKKKKTKKNKDKSKDKESAWGSHGIISTTDYYAKDSEFRAWLIDVKHVSPEDRDAKKYFDEFVEDYNMGILPHEKYYNMDKWDRQQILSQYQQNSSAQQEFDFARDEQLMKQQQRASKLQNLPSVTMSTDELRELKRVQEERIMADKMRKQGFQPKQSMGVRYEDSK
ncbi:hypothetical protein BCR33DRAFT_850537 [Rhizoclosmatium globosum]|uniref:Uncharacterized protein n=1 Tax=Rhizoclosmatium globosum TaxID=329046 RepID=A0A1Y2CC58_9FUNG|nr:hypothetical protein BCR33DRAFT_850537 [Rhizoclosmatium globosum]|eukprot:ORY44434.1 hypothetical protein BCR33DRAFT_850537 [Rhizoclosmatium globosum]